MTTALLQQVKDQLKEGEIYAGILLGKDGAPDQHIILLPGQANDVDWNTAKEWAANIGGELPTRREQSLLFANLKEEFEERFYWSSEQHEANPHCAWGQYFGVGLQYVGRKGDAYRGRAVRRLVIS